MDCRHEFGGLRPEGSTTDMKSEVDWILSAARRRMTIGKKDKLGRDSETSHIVGLTAERHYAKLTDQEVHVDFRKGWLDEVPDFDDGTEVKASNEKTWAAHPEPRWNIRHSSIIDEKNGVEHWPPWRFAFILVDADFWKATIVGYVEPPEAVKSFPVVDWGRRGVPAWSPTYSMVAVSIPFDECIRCGFTRPPVGLLPHQRPPQGSLF